MPTLQNHRSQINRNSRPHGGQTSIGLFGLPGTSRFPASAQVAPAIATTPAPAKPSAPAQRMAARREAALASVSQIDRLTAFFAKKDAAREAMRDAALFGEEPRATATQNLVAAARDAREAFPQYADDEEADFAHRCVGAGYVEATLAMEGN